MERYEDRTRDVSYIIKEGSDPVCKLKATPGKRQSRTRERLRSRSKILDGRIFPSPAPMKDPCRTVISDRDLSYYA